MKYLSYTKVNYFVNHIKVQKGLVLEYSFLFCDQKVVTCGIFLFTCILVNKDSLLIAVALKVSACLKKLS